VLDPSAHVPFRLAAGAWYVTDNVAHTGTMSASKRVPARGWNLVVFASALRTGVGVALAPTVSTYSCYTSEAETARCWSSSVSLFSNEGSVFWVSSPYLRWSRWCRW
jgi:hypothetical protein